MRDASTAWGEGEGRSAAVQQAEEAAAAAAAHFLARRTAVTMSDPLASSAAMAEARLQPVPWVLPVLQQADRQAGRGQGQGGPIRGAR